MQNKVNNKLRGTERRSNLELLRIVAMVMIVAHHFAIHGGFNYSNETITINRLWIQFLEIGGKIGVNIFVLISGYFLISSETIKTNKIIKLWGQIFFYSLGIYLLFIILGLSPFGVFRTIKRLAPITYCQWWFASTYFVLYLLIPYINKFLKSFDKRNYKRFLFFLLFIWCVIPTITDQHFESNNLLWFIVVYAVAGYIRLYGIKTNLTGIKLIGLSVIWIFLTYLSAIVFDIIGLKMPVFIIHLNYFYN